ncbi:hypothetical protein A6A08_06905 [Nocardiopsis sp. TSRI0078]|uniref:DUF429 domain-containing protein n=1 Tax=unclassified Nocardiopsis TaxID=2649073 RepID=UPI00093969D4|nr:DUF429 domain-containing protein [Nocardiopsis sp. TSRI0078]OKI17249.1 hypothetical protein A6A08_06905 [Nocardiopsis sp. TSRI0078]
MTAGRTDNAHVEVVGVDACRKGWMAVRLVDGRFRDARLCDRLKEVTAKPGSQIVAVDIPLGLTDREWRECDLRVPALLGPRSHSVFRVPSRAVVETADYAEANALCRDMTGRGLTRQAHALFPKILEADRIRRSGADHLYEVHPELSFRTMAGAPLSWAKRTWNGQRHRHALLAEEGIVLPEDLGAAGEAAVDDVLDAAAAAWSAHRIALDRALSCPESEQLDASGRPIAIWR